MTAFSPPVEQAIDENQRALPGDRSHVRLVGFDVVRLISFLIISFYHFLYAVWRNRVPQFENTMVQDPFFGNGIYPALRSLSFSGHTILFMSVMLIAIAQKTLSQTLRLSAFLFLAWLGFVWAEYDFKALVPFWDVHPLLLLGLLSIAIAERINPRLVIILAILGFFGTWISFWKIDVFKIFPLGLRSSLVGDCEADVSSWPILPWVGFLWCGFGCGFALRRQSVRDALSTFHRSEIVAWSLLLIPAAFNLGTFYKLDALNDWECHAFRLPPLDFWSHFIWVVFAIRLSLLTRLNLILTARLPWLRRLHVSKNFFLAYALQYVFGFAIALVFGDFLRSHPLAFTMTGLMMLPIAELVARLGSSLGARRLFKGESKSNISK